MSWDWISKLKALTEQGESLVLVTVGRCSGSTPRETGAKMIVRADGSFFGTVGGGGLEKEALKDALRALREGRSQTVLYPLHASVGQCCGGVVELLYEVIFEGPSLYLFGAGHVGQALCSILNETPFQVHVIDEREEWVHSDRLPAQVQRHLQPWQEFVSKAKWDEKKTYVAIMTHEHEQDYELLGSLLEKPARYLGLIGSQTKWKSFQAKLVAEGVKSEKLGRVRCPVGLNIGGKSPQEVAISIAAELLKIHYER